MPLTPRLTPDVRRLNYYCAMRYSKIGVEDELLTEGMECV